MTFSELFPTDLQSIPKINVNNQNNRFIITVKRFCLYCKQKAFSYGFGRFFHAVINPPSDGFNKGCGYVIDAKILRQFFVFFTVKRRQLVFYKLFKICFKVLQKKFVVSA